MTDYYFIAFSIVTLLLSAAAVAATLVRTIRTRARQREQQRAIDHADSLIDDIVFGNIPNPRLTSAPVSNTSKLVTATLLGRITRLAYAVDRDAASDYAEALRIPQFIYRKIAHTRGWTRTYYTALAAQMPMSEASFRAIAALPQPRHRHTQHQLLLLHIAASPTTFIRSIELHPHPFTPLEMESVVALFRQGGTPIAYEPLLLSSNDNVVLVGLSIVRHFALAEAEPIVAEVCDSPLLDKYTQLDALYTLASMNMELSQSGVKALVGRLNHAERKRLCYYLIGEGYAESTLARLFSVREQLYAKSLSSSYKKKIIYADY